MYVFLCDIKEEYLLCTQLETTTTAEDVMEKLSSFFKANSYGNAPPTPAPARLECLVTVESIGPLVVRAKALVFLG